MSVKLSNRRTGSWFHPEDARRKSAELTAALRQRFKGKRPLFLTLTYDRSEFDNAQDCYHRGSDERHVRAFIGRLSAYLGKSLTGLWICKLEWQDADGEGWPHFHLLIDWPGFISHSVLVGLWGWGHPHIKRASSEHIAYFSKYFGKSGGAPGWLMMERPKSVKVIRVSPGFWNKERVDREPVAKKYKWPLYVPLGAVLERAGGGVTVHCDSSSRVRSFDVGLVRAASCLRSVGVPVSSDGTGRIRARAEFSVVCGLLASAARAQAADDRIAAIGGDTVGGLYLKRTTNPRRPRWLEDYFEACGVVSWGRAV